MRWKIFLFLIYVLFGFYFINVSLNFVEIPEFISDLDSWIMLIGGALIILSGFEHFLIGGRNKKILAVNE
ncbi:hypothetical protein J4407_03455 [Candidatus Pacearchaeota archaeon]|nr:hypothetical protein [Candidatus Pacearchaeota archaeon]